MNLETRKGRRVISGARVLPRRRKVHEPAARLPSRGSA
jgi:hypothetical protein